MSKAIVSSESFNTELRVWNFQLEEGDRIQGVLLQRIVDADIIQWCEGSNDPSGAIELPLDAVTLEIAPEDKIQN